MMKVLTIIIWASFVSAWEIVDSQSPSKPPSPPAIPATATKAPDLRKYDEDESDEETDEEVDEKTDDDIYNVEVERREEGDVIITENCSSYKRAKWHHDECTCRTPYKYFHAIKHDIGCYSRAELGNNMTITNANEQGLSRLPEMVTEEVMTNIISGCPKAYGVTVTIEYYLFVKNGFNKTSFHELIVETKKHKGILFAVYRKCGNKADTEIIVLKHGGLDSYFANKKEDKKPKKGLDDPEKEEIRDIVIKATVGSVVSVLGIIGIIAAICIICWRMKRRKKRKKKKEEEKKHCTAKTKNVSVVINEAIEDEPQYEYISDVHLNPQSIQQKPYGPTFYQRLVFDESPEGRKVFFVTRQESNRNIQPLSYKAIIDSKSLPQLGQSSIPTELHADQVHSRYENVQKEDVLMKLREIYEDLSVVAPSNLHSTSKSDDSTAANAENKLAESQDYENNTEDGDAEVEIDDYFPVNIPPPYPGKQSEAV